MPTLLIYGIVALGIVGSLAGIAWKLDHNGYERGVAEVQVKWDEANAAAKQAAEADRARQDALRQAKDEEASRRLADEKRRTATLWTSLEAHIKAAGTAAQCPMPDSLRDDWNSANAGPEGKGSGPVPAAGRAATPTR